MRLVAGIIVEVFLELALDDAALLLDDQDFALAAHEFERAARRERPDHADLVDIEADLPAGRLVESQQP